MQDYMPVEYNNGVSTVSIVIINLKQVRRNLTLTRYPKCVTSQFRTFPKEVNHEPVTSFVKGCEKMSAFWGTTLPMYLSFLPSIEKGSFFLLVQT